MGQNPGGQRDGDTQSGRTAQNQTNSGQQRRQSEPNQRTGQGSQQQTPNEQPPTNDGTARTRGTQRRGLGEEIAGWFTETIVRAVVAVFGIALLLLAIGQIFGANVLGAVAEFMTSGIGGWLIVAFLALMLIVAAGKNWRASRH